jgi:hypothetical protein
VQGIEGSTITIVKRSGGTLTVDAAPAFANSLVNSPRIGGAVVARGSIDEGGVLLAQTLLRAKSNPAIWPPDR